MKSIEFVTRDDLISINEKLRELAKMQECLTRGKHQKVYTNSEVADLFEVSKRTLQNWRDAGLIDFSQIKSKIYYTAEDVQHFIARNKVKSFKVKDLR